MMPRTDDRQADRIILSRTRRSKADGTPRDARTYLWTLAGGVVGSTILFWVMVQLGQASPDAKGKISPVSASSTKQETPTSASTRSAEDPQSGKEGTESVPQAPTPQGPALDTPREILEMLDLRKRDLDRREEAVRQNEERLLMVKAEIEQLLSKNEALEKRIQDARAKQAQVATNSKAQQNKAQVEREQQAQAQLAKIYESMPAEEAAARIERLPDRKAIELLRLIKGKTAGAILAQVKADRAARLTEQLLVQVP